MTVPGLPLLNKLLYTSDMIGGQAVAQAGNLWLLFFLAPPRTEGASDAVPGIALGPFDVDARVFVGALLTAGRFIEALDDPVIGWWSDRTKSRWGRRLPFVVFSTPFYAIFFMLLWHTPAEGASFVNAIWVFVILELFFLSNSMSIGPYESLLPEIAKGHRDRMSIVAWQFYFGVLGAVLGLVVSGVVQDTWGFQVMGVMVGVLGLGFRYLGVAGVWRHAPRDTPPAQMPLKGAFLATLSNTQFLYFLPTFVLYQLSTTMTLGWMPFFVKAILGAENEGFVTSLLTGTALVGMMVAVFAMWKLSHTKGKRWVYSLCLLGTAVILPFMFFVGFVPGMPILAQGIVSRFLSGCPWAASTSCPAPSLPTLRTTTRSAPACAARGCSSRAKTSSRRWGPPSPRCSSRSSCCWARRRTTRWAFACWGRWRAPSHSWATGCFEATGCPAPSRRRACGRRGCRGSGSVRAASSSGGRSRLPTWSARYGVGMAVSLRRGWG